MVSDTVYAYHLSFIIFVDEFLFQSVMMKTLGMAIGYAISYYLGTQNNRT